MLKLVPAILLLLCVQAHSADRITECEPQRISDNRYWSYRIVDGRTCWYPGRPGKPKAELRWSTPPSKRLVTSEAEQPGDPIVHPVVSGAAPAEPIIEEEKPWQATMEDQLIAFTCCWPELEPSRILNKTQDRVSELPSATPPSRPLWPLTLLLIIATAVSALLIRRRLA